MISVGAADERGCSQLSKCECERVFVIKTLTNVDNNQMEIDCDVDGWVETKWKYSTRGEEGLIRGCVGFVIVRRSKHGGMVVLFFSNH